MNRLILFVLAFIAVFASDTMAQERKKKFEIRYAVVGAGTKRNATLENSVGRGSAMMSGGEISVRTSKVGLAASLIGGSFQADSGFEASGGIAIGALRVTAGPEIFSGEVGYTVRALSGNYGTRRWRFFRAGIHSSIPLGASGFHASARAALFLHVKGSGVPGTGTGKEAETRLTYIVPKTPFFLAVGYRVEGFTVNAARNARPEEMSGLLLGGGIRLAR